MEEIHKIMITKMKKKLHESFSMKEFKNAMYILRIWIEQHRSQKIRRLLQTKYVQKVLWSFNMTNFRLTRTTLLMLTQLRRTPSTAEEKEHMKGISYASSVGSLNYAMVTTRADLLYDVGVNIRDILNSRMRH